MTGLRRLGPMGVVLLVMALLGFAASAPAQQSRPGLLPDIEDEVMCPICGTPLELSQSPQAERERVFIRGLIAQGRSKQQIKDALVREYGPEVLAVPEDHGFGLLAWLVPGALLAAGIALIVVRMRRRARDQAPPPAVPLDSAERSRLDSELEEFGR